MKKRWLSLLPVLCMMLWVAPVTALADAGDIAINETNFPDEKFRGIVKEKYDKDDNGSLNLSERESATWIQCNDKGIGSLKGIEYFSKLDKLECNNNNLTMLDLSENTQLTKLQCQKNQLTSLDLSANTQLQELRCENNKLESLDVSGSDLQYFYCSNNQLTSLNLDGHASLKDFDCSDNELSTLEIGTKNYLMRISCQQNNLASLDVNNVPELQYLYCNSNQLTELDVSQNSKLKELECQSNQLESLDVSMNTKLERLQCYHNHLTSLDISSCAVINDENFKGDSNTYSITFDENMEFDLNTLPGNFKVAKSTNWENGKVDGNTLKPNGGNPGAVGYSYDCGQGKTVHFHLNVSYTHTHAYDGTWKQDESKHWHECTDSLCPDKKGSVTDSAAHVYYNDADKTCKICGYVRTVTVPHTHIYGAWTHDTSKHWKECTVCKVRIGETAHTYDSNGTCTTCGYKKPSGSWKQNQNGWWYQYTNGTWPSNSWVKLPVQGGEAWYYFNKDGYMATGWLFENKNWYYLDPQTGKNNGRMMTGWQQIGGQWYYFKQNGSMATGWNYINKNWYYFSTDKLAGEGSMYADRMTPDGFYVNKDGVWVQ